MTSNTSSRNNTRRSAAETLKQIVDFFKQHSEVILLITSIVLIILAVIVVNLLVTQAYGPFFKCEKLFGEYLGLNVICKGVHLQIGPYHIELPRIPTFTILGIDITIPGIDPFTVGPFPEPALSIVEGQGDNIDNLLEPVRRFFAWNTIIAIAVVSLVLAFIASKVLYFVRLLLDPKGRRDILTSISLYLLIFGIFCALFYFGYVVPSLGK